jgi:dTDP-4-dehydrorhamnose 3,5-epimerase
VEVLVTSIRAVKIIRPAKYADKRGFFSETYNKRALAEAGIELEFVQDNHSLSLAKGVVRGLHYQIPPFAQDKLIRVLRGSVLDVAVDLRRGSPTFRQHVSVPLSADNCTQMFIPQGFAHGYVTLEPNTEVFYKVSNYYSPETERGLFWADPELGIPWPFTLREAVVSERDKRFPLLQELQDFFEMNGKE